MPVLIQNVSNIVAEDETVVSIDLQYLPFL